MGDVFIVGSALAGLAWHGHFNCIGHNGLPARYNLATQRVILKNATMRVFSRDFRMRYDDNAGDKKYKHVITGYPDRFDLCLHLIF